MLGFARAKAAPFSVALCVAFAFQLGIPVAPAEAAPPGYEDSSDIEMTTTEPGATGKPASTKVKKSKKGKKGKTEEVVPEVFELEEEPERPPPEPKPRARFHQNWVTLSIQQDLLFFSTQADVCPSTTGMGLDVPGTEHYSCRDAAGVYQGPVVNGVGNTVEGGFGVATTRLLVGYDRVFIDRLTVGGRLGWAFRTAPTVPDDGAAIPFHLEVRSAFYFGSAPFESRGVRPFASLGAGIGEVDGKKTVGVYAQSGGPVTELDAWRKTGLGFVALGGGAAYPIGDFMINAELRAILLFGVPAFALGFGLGGAYGF